MDAGRVLEVERAAGGSLGGGQAEQGWCERRLPVPSRHKGRFDHGIKVLLAGSVTARFHFDAFADGVAGVDGHLLSFFETREHFQAVAEIAAQLDAREVDLAVGIHYGHLRSVAAHHQGVAGNEQRRIAARHRKIHLGVHAGQQGPLEFGT